MTRHEFIQQNDLDLRVFSDYDVVPCVDCPDKCCQGWVLKHVASLPQVFIWLDDMRPIPEIVWAGEGPKPTILALKDIEQVKRAFGECRIYGMSLDHDLGACEACNKAMASKLLEVAPYADVSDPEVVWLFVTGGAEMPNCEHAGTGYDLVKWMAEHGLWPKQKPTVHSANTVGAENMTKTIDRYFGTRRYTEE